MKLRIGETDYDYKTAIRKITLRDLMRLQSQGGPNRRQIQLAWDMIDRGLSKSGAEADEVLDQPEVLLGMAGTIFVCKAYAGEQVSWDDAQNYAWPEDVRFILEAEDVQLPDPPVASGEASQPDAETKNGKRSQGKTPGKSTPKTSKPRSTGTS